MSGFTVRYKPLDMWEFEVHCDNTQEMFQKIGAISEIIRASSKCGKCGCEKIQLVHREVGKFSYFEAHCLACRAKLSFGTKQDADKNLYPRRVEIDPKTNEPAVDSDGRKKMLPSNGWVRWNFETNQNE